MPSKQSNPNSQPVIASALLAVAFVVISSREQAYTEADIDRTPPAKCQEFAGEVQSQRWYERFSRAVDRWLIKLFHCALPSGLEPKDLDLYNLYV
jgi:hypothetical protein